MAGLFLNKKRQKISCGCIVSHLLGKMQNAWALCFVLSSSCIAFVKLIFWRICCCTSCCGDLSHCRISCCSCCGDMSNCCILWDVNVQEIWSWHYPQLGQKYAHKRSRIVVWVRRLLCRAVVWKLQETGSCNCRAIVWDRKLLDSRSRVVICFWFQRNRAKSGMIVPKHFIHTLLSSWVVSVNIFVVALWIECFSQCTTNEKDLDQREQH